jgi:hypothetical protein
MASQRELTLIENTTYQTMVILILLLEGKSLI